MLELIDYLGANEFKIFIVSGNGADFIRVFAEQTYRIPPERVVGSTTVAEFRVGKAGPLLMKMPEVEVLSDGPGKPEAIERFIGRRPIFAFGNSDGDKEMLEWTVAGPGARTLASHRYRARMGIRSGFKGRASRQGTGAGAREGLDHCRHGG